MGTRMRTGAMAVILVLTGLIGGLVACGQKGASSSETPLVRVGSRTITVRDFNRAFEIGKAAFTHNAIQDSALAHKARIRLLNQMIEEAMLLDQAQQLQVLLSEAELSTALADIRKDYPEDSFEQMLLEAAISFADWKERFRTRLLIEKLIDQVLAQNIVITPEEIGDTYRKHADSEAERADEASGESDPGGIGRIKEIIVRQLRRQKLEEAYRKWLAHLNQQYTVEINTAQWQALTGSTWTGFQADRAKNQRQILDSGTDVQAAGAPSEAD
ncbi:MAG: SurA N-terminal domain-containing protein [Desulfobacterales bacterium]|nr:SurA N-terminal domain-containing protein [Desulfobacterales bacterium]